MARRLLILTLVDRGVIATAQELYEARHFPSVVAMITDALDHEPECVELLLIRARAHISLRRDLDAQADLRDVIRLDHHCAMAFRLLGVLAARRDENAAAATFFQEALRLDPDDQEAHDWLMIVDSLRPAAVAHKLPAPAAAAGRFARPESQPRFAKGTTPPVQAPAAHDYERVTQPRIARGSERSVATPRPLPTLPLRADPSPTLTGLPMPPPPAKPAPRARIRPLPTPELPGFGEYLVASGILTRERLRAAQAYQRSMKVQLTTAIVTLGLATPQRIEWACVAHQSQVGQKRT